MKVTTKIVLVMVVLALVFTNGVCVVVNVPEMCITSADTTQNVSMNEHAPADQSADGSDPHDGHGGGQRRPTPTRTGTRSARLDVRE